MWNFVKTAGLALLFVAARSLGAEVSVRLTNPSAGRFYRVIFRCFCCDLFLFQDITGPPGVSGMVHCGESNAGRASTALSGHNQFLQYGLILSVGQRFAVTLSQIGTIEM